MYSTILKQLCIYVITWNVNTQLPDSQTSFDGLLGLDHQTSITCVEPDLYVIGLQEVNSQPKNLISRLFKDDAWTSKFRNILANRDYVTVRVEQMQGLLVGVFAKRKHVLHIRDIEADNTKTGIGGFWGNKGAVSIRMNLYDSSLTFVSAHLAAHDDQLDKRIQDYKHIINEHHYHVNNYRHIFDHDYVFWFGDLNFRLTDTSLKPKDIRNMIHENQLEELFQRDQLNLVKQQNKAFEQFEEQTPTFPPTFKFHLKSSEYNLKRRPAWTDRILYRTSKQTEIYQNFTLNIKQLSYKTHFEYTISDHKPVTGKFLVNIFEDSPRKFIEFSYIPQWQIEEENIIEYTIPDDFQEQDGDWIGIFPNDYKSLNDYLAYEYTNHNEKNENKRYMRVGFPENVNIVENKDFILLYFQSSNSRHINSVAGMSNVFKATVSIR